MPDRENNKTKKSGCYACKYSKPETLYGRQETRCLLDDMLVMRPSKGCTQLKKKVMTNAEPVRHGRWNDDCTEVVCSICKSEFSYEMLIFIARGIKSEHVDGMTCRCPKCGSYNIYGGADNG